MADSQRSKRLEELFLAACDLPVEECSAWLQERCGDDPELRREVEALVERYRQMGDFLEEPALDQPGFRDIVDDYFREGQPDDQIGRYHLRKRLGEGGMGVVYLAEQQEPIRRQVALKLIKLGMDTERVVARFESERQALALMNHPNVASVFDAGATEQGRPYFVMEYVSGDPITAYCDTHELSLSERLKLFVQVCQAIQHAHQKGIIHRDIKPSNVLVTSEDDKPVPKVIDFGVAKATSQRQAEETAFTEQGLLVGTPAYMSPEQAQTGSQDIDTRTDVYSLGVLLYELMTSSLPFDPQSLRSEGFAGIQRMIREVEPSKPSTKFDSLQNTDAESSSDAAGKRRLDPRTLIRRLRGDLDWIVMKALEKDRSRRYDSPLDLATDVERYLSNEPVVAGPPSVGYRIHKFIRRNRAGIIVAALLLTFLLTGITTTTWQAITATNERNRALAAEKQEKSARERAEADHKKAEKALRRETAALREADNRRKKEELARKEAEDRRRDTETVLRFFEDKILATARPEGKAGGLGVDVTIRQALNAAEPKIAESFKDQPLIEASIRLSLGNTYHYLGEAHLAIAQHKRALAILESELEPDHPDTLTSMNNLALTFQDAGRLNEALPLFEKTLKCRKEKLGTNHPDTLVSMSNLAGAYQDAGRLDEALPLFEKTLKCRKEKLGTNHPDTLTSMNNLALAYKAAGRLDEALPLLEKTLKRSKEKLGINHQDTLASMSNLASAYQAAGRLDEALPLLEETLKRRKKKLGINHPDTHTSMNNLASAYQNAGRLDEALPLLEETLKHMKKKLGTNHPSTLTLMNNLASAYRDAGRLNEALPLLEETLKRWKKKLGMNHPNTLILMGNLALAYQDAGRLDKVLPLLEETLKRWEEKLGTNHTNTLISMSNLANAYRTAGRVDKALPLLEETLKRWKKKLGTNHPKTLTSMNNLALAYQDAGRLNEALPLLEETFKCQKEKLGTNHPNTLVSMSNLAGAYQDAGRLDEALTLFEQYIVVIRKQYPKPNDPRFAKYLELVGHTLLKYKQYSAAKTYLQECLDIRKKTMPDSSELYYSKILLGIALRGMGNEFLTNDREAALKNFKEAESLLLDSYQGIKQQEKSIQQSGQYLEVIMKCLCGLYATWGKSDEAAKWRTELKKRSTDEKNTSGTKKERDGNR